MCVLSCHANNLNTAALFLTQKGSDDRHLVVVPVQGVVVLATITVQVSENPGCEVEHRLNWHEPTTEIPRSSAGHTNST